jgi:hypothetical protein
MPEKKINFLVRITTGETEVYSVKHLIKRSYTSNTTKAAGFAERASSFFDFFFEDN